MTPWGCWQVVSGLRQCCKSYARYLPWELGWRVYIGYQVTMGTQVACVFRIPGHHGSLASRKSDARSVVHFWFHFVRVPADQGIWPREAYTAPLQVVTNPYDRTKIKLLFINKTEDDIVLRHELDRLAMEYPETLEVISCPIF